MKIAFRCECGQKLTAQSHLTGVRVKCPNCAARAVVPSDSDEEFRNVPATTPTISAESPTSIPKPASKPEPTIEPKTETPTAADRGALAGPPSQSEPIQPNPIQQQPVSANPTPVPSIETKLPAIETKLPAIETKLPAIETKLPAQPVSPAQPKPVESAGSVPQRDIKLQCKCGQTFKVSSDFVGKKLPCPGCGAACTIPAPSPKQFPKAPQVSPVPVAPPQTNPNVTVRPVGVPSAIPVQPAQHQPNANQPDLAQPIHVRAVPVQPVAGNPIAHPQAVDPFAVDTEPYIPSAPAAVGISQVPSSIPSNVNPYVAPAIPGGQAIGPSGGDIQKWGRVRTGMLVAAIATCVLSGAMAFAMFAEAMVHSAIAMAEATRPPRRPSINSSRTTIDRYNKRVNAFYKKAASRAETMRSLNDASGVFIKLSYVIGMLASIAMIVGFIFCLNVPPGHGGFGLATTLVCLLGLTVIIQLVFKVVPAFGDKLAYDHSVFVGVTATAFQFMFGDSTGHRVLSMLFDLVISTALIFAPIFLYSIGKSTKNKSVRFNSLWATCLISGFAVALLIVYLMTFMDLDPGDKWQLYMRLTIHWVGNMALAVGMFFLIRSFFLALKATRKLAG